MSHQFDTRMLKAQRTLIRDAIVAQVAPLLKTSSSGEGYLGAVLPFGAVISGASDDLHLGMLWDLLQGKAPAVAIALGNKNYTAAGDQYRFKGPLDVHVYLVVNSLRSHVARQAGDVVSTVDSKADPGADTILEQLEQQLIGVNLGLGDSIKELRPVAEEFVISDGALALWEARYQLVVGRTIDHQHRRPAQQLDEIVTTHRASDDNSRAPIVITRTEVF